MDTRVENSVAGEGILLAWRDDLAPLAMKAMLLMFSSRDGCRSRKIQLLSDRFSRSSGRPRKKLSSTQRAYFGRLQEMADRGDVWFVHGPCLCDQQANDILVARRDRYGLPVDSVLCDGCGTVRLDPYFDDASLGRFYTEIYQELYGRSRDPLEYMERQRVYGEKILQNLGSGLNPDRSRVLEVGCGAGGAIRVFQEFGFAAAGCDYSRELIEFGVSHGVQDLVWGSVEAIASPTTEEEQFDLIYLHHVLEHVGQPLESLRTMQRLLKPNGRILMIVPDLFHVESHKLSPYDCMELFHIAHKWNFTRECFAALAHQIGLHALEIAPVGQSTIWSNATEMWVLFQRAPIASALSVPGEGTGRRYLEYLRNAERHFTSIASRSGAWSAILAALN